MRYVTKTISGRSVPKRTFLNISFLVAPLIINRFTNKKEKTSRIPVCLTRNASEADTPAKNSILLELPFMPFKYKNRERIKSDKNGISVIKAKVKRNIQGKENRKKVKATDLKN